jgi:hypothetical protein
LKLNKKSFFGVLGLLVSTIFLSMHSFAKTVPVVDSKDVHPYALESKKTAKQVVKVVQARPISSLKCLACGGPTYYSQKDPQWSGAVFGGYTFGGTGCVPTSIAMIMGGLPLDWGQELYDVHLYDGGAGGEAIVYAGEKANRAVKPIYSHSQLRELLSSGWAVIALCNPPIAPLGFSHAVVVYGLNGDMTTVLDPLENRVSGLHLVQEIWNARSMDSINMGKAGTSLYGVSGSFGDGGTLLVFRVYNPNGDRHLLTLNSFERDQLVDLGWRDERIAFNLVGGSIPIYRLYNPNDGEHLYTANSFERDALLKVGWHDEGIAFYVLNLGVSKGEGTAVYRMRNPRNSEHMYTINYNEIENATKNLGWEYEGIAFRI